MVVGAYVMGGGWVVCDGWWVGGWYVMGGGWVGGM